MQVLGAIQSSGRLPTPLLPCKSKTETFMLSPHHVPPRRNEDWVPGLEIASIFFSPKIMSEAPQDFILPISDSKAQAHQLSSSMVSSFGVLQPRMRAAIAINRRV